MSIATLAALPTNRLATIRLFRQKAEDGNALSPMARSAAVPRGGTILGLQIPDVRLNLVGINGSPPAGVKKN